MIKTEDFRFVRPLVGFETFAKGELIATDGDGRDPRALRRLHRSSCRRARPIVGREAVYLTRPI